MKRGQEKASDSKGYLISLSDVYDVTFKKSTKYHQKDETIQVSLPIAIKFLNEGKVGMTEELILAIKEAGMESLIEEQYLLNLKPKK